MFKARFFEGETEPVVAWMKMACPKFEISMALGSCRTVQKKRIYETNVIKSYGAENKLTRIRRNGKRGEMLSPF